MRNNLGDIRVLLFLPNIGGPPLVDNRECRENRQQFPLLYARIGFHK